jgi:predicted transcriptional regulator
MRKDPEITMDKIAKALQVSRSALYRQLGPALERKGFRTKLLAAQHASVLVAAGRRRRA